MEEYPFEKNKIPENLRLTSEDINTKEKTTNSLFPHVIGETFIAIAGCSKKEWNIVFVHAVIFAMILDKEKIFFIWDDKIIKHKVLEKYPFFKKKENFKEYLAETYSIGSHVPFQDTPYNTIMSFCYMTSMQMYVSPANENSKFNKTCELSRVIPKLGVENPSCCALMMEGERKVFCHASQALNLGNVNNAYYVRDLIKYCSAHQFQGVVFHCGRVTAGKDKDSVIEIMINNIVEGLSGVNMIYSKFLLETPAGQKGELLTVIKQFIKFIKHLMKEERIGKYISTCVDTCHVYSAGYDPYFYIKELIANDIPIGLVHFNNSKNEFDSRTDRHANPSTGPMPQIMLEDVAKLCVPHDIPMIFEC